MDNVAFRKDSNLQALHVSYFGLQRFVWTPAGVFVYCFNLGSVTFIALQYIPALAGCQWSPEHLRNRVFLTLAGVSRRDRVSPLKLRKGIICKYRFYIGKLVAGLGYLFAILLFIISPFAFVSSVLINELLM